MRKQFLLLLILLFSFLSFGQTKGVKIGYIDMEYILQNVPNYADAIISYQKRERRFGKTSEQIK